ncbi:transposase, partial [Saccharothrix sp. ST-888]
ARELGVSPEGLRGWVKQDRTDRGEDRAGELTSAEREERTRLPRQPVEQHKTSEVLRKAAAYFAAETTR